MYYAELATLRQALIACSYLLIHGWLASAFTTQHKHPHTWERADPFKSKATSLRSRNSSNQPRRGQYSINISCITGRDGKRTGHASFDSGYKLLRNAIKLIQISIPPLPNPPPRQNREIATRNVTPPLWHCLAFHPIQPLLSIQPPRYGDDNDNKKRKQYKAEQTKIKQIEALLEQSAISAPTPFSALHSNIKLRLPQTKPNPVEYNKNKTAAFKSTQSFSTRSRGTPWIECRCWCYRLSAGQKITTETKHNYFTTTWAEHDSSIAQQLYVTAVESNSGPRPAITWLCVNHIGMEERSESEASAKKGRGIPSLLLQEINWVIGSGWRLQPKAQVAHTETRTHARTHESRREGKKQTTNGETEPTRTEQYRRIRKKSSHVGHTGNRIIFQSQTPQLLHSSTGALKSLDPFLHIFLISARELERIATNPSKLKRFWLWLRQFN